jgi:hypothetical protein
MLRFVVAVLATWRVTHLLVSEDGPADLIVRFRGLFGQSWAGRLMDCFYCCSLWIAALAALYISSSPMEWLLNWLALSGGACLLERSGKREGDIDHVLRPETPTAVQPRAEEGTERPAICLR